MTSPDTVFAMFVEANPIPDDSLPIASIPAPEDLLHRLEETPATPEAATPSITGRRVLAAAVALVSVVLLGGLFLFMELQSPDPEPAGPEEALRVEAIAAIDTLIAARNQGDIETVLAISSPAPAGRALAERRLHEFQAEFAIAGMPAGVECEASEVAPPVVTGICTSVLTDPVAVELGASNQTSAFRYESGLLTILEYEGDSILEVNRAYAEYLSAAHPDDYAAACQPSMYEPGTVVQSELLALTGECAAVAAPLANEVVEWIRAGRPDG